MHHHRMMYTRRPYSAPLAMGTTPSPWIRLLKTPRTSTAHNLIIRPFHLSPPLPRLGVPVSRRPLPHSSSPSPHPHGPLSSPHLPRIQRLHHLDLIVTSPPPPRPSHLPRHPLPSLVPHASLSQLPSALVPLLL